MNTDHEVPEHPTAATAHASTAQAPTDGGGGTPEWLRDAVRQVESDERWDPVADNLASAAAPLRDGPAGGLLRGEWLGHALHPLMSDLPLGFWTSSVMLDLFGGRKARAASRRLVGLGVLTSLPTAVTGLAELTTVEDRRIRRVAAVHAVGNSVVLGCYALSHRARRKDHHLRGVMLGLAGGSVAVVTGYLGGHMSFARGTGVQDRGIDHSLQPASSSGSAGSTASTDSAGDAPAHQAESPFAPAQEVRGEGSADLLGVEQAAHELTMAVEQVHTLVEQGVLTAAEQEPMRFLRADVEAVRMMGG